jgi:hypothetical protein
MWIPEQLPLNPYERINATGVTEPEIFCEFCDARIRDDENVRELGGLNCCEQCYADLVKEEEICCMS